MAIIEVRFHGVTMSSASGLNYGVRAGMLVVDDSKPCLVHVAERPSVLERSSGSL